VETGFVESYLAGFCVWCFFGFGDFLFRADFLRLLEQAVRIRKTFFVRKEKKLNVRFRKKLGFNRNKPNRQSCKQ
jgi:hypothetical protein